jgi:hypothetical protein
LFAALLGVVCATNAFSLTGAVGLADRIALREGYSQYEGKIDLRDASNSVIFYYWGGARCPSALTPPTDRQVDVLLNAHLSGHAVSLDYTNFTSSYGQSRCWDGGIQVY